MGGSRGERIFERGLERQTSHLQAAATGHVHRSCNSPLDKDVFLHPSGGASDVDPVGYEITGRRPGQAFPEPLPIPLEPKDHPPFGDLADGDLQNNPLPRFRNASPAGDDV